MEGYLFDATMIGALLWTIRNMERTLNSDVQTVEVLTLSLWGALKGSLRGALYGVALGVTAGVAVALFVLTYGDPWRTPSSAQPAVILQRPEHALLVVIAFAPLVTGLGGLCLGATLGAFKTGIRATKNRPNEGILLSIKNGLFVALVVGGAATAVASLLGYSESPGIHVGYGGLLAGTIAVIFYAGLDIVEHFVLRLIIFLRHQAPFEYANFLDYVARLTFVRKVGGGYIFLHPLMVDYFATHSGNANEAAPDAQ